LSWSQAVSVSSQVQLEKPSDRWLAQQSLPVHVDPFDEPGTVAVAHPQLPIEPVHE
jgi:hypothetical protein